MSVKEKECILNSKLIVVNIGLVLFTESLQQQGVDVKHVQWSPESQVAADVKKVLEKFL